MTSPWNDLLLRQPLAGETKYFRARHDGKTVISTAWSDKRKPRESRKEAKIRGSSEEMMGKKAALAQAADELLEKTVREKMLEGFVYVREEPTSEPGTMVFAARAPVGANGEAFGVDPAGRTLFLAAGRGDPKASLVFVDVATGRSTRRDLRGKTPDEQLFIHTGLIDAPGRRGFYALRETVREHDRETGQERVVSSYREWQDSQFNPFCVKPCLDDARRRLLVATTKNRLQVLDVDSLQPLCTVTVGSKTAECRAITISPSGKLIAAYIASRHRIYSHKDAVKDQTCEVRVWRVDDGQQIACIPFTDSLDDLGIDPTDQHLLVLNDHKQGPFVHSIATGALIHDLRLPTNPHYPSENAPYCLTWACSGSGEQMALSVAADDHDIRLHDARTQKLLWKFHTRQGSPDRLAFASGDRLIFASSRGLIAAYTTTSTAFTVAAPASAAPAALATTTSATPAKASKPAKATASKPASTSRTTKTSGASKPARANKPAKASPAIKRATPPKPARASKPASTSKPAKTSGASKPTRASKLTKASPAIKRATPPAIKRG